MNLPFRQFATFSTASFSRWVCNVALAFGVLFSFASTSQASVILYCRRLRSARIDGTVYGYTWVTWENGGAGGYAGDVLAFPFLASYNHASGSATSGFQYWQKGYSTTSAPVLYTVDGVSSFNFTIPNGKEDTLPEVLDQLGQLLPTGPRQSAVSGRPEISYDEDGNPSVSVPVYSFGKVIGTGVVTLDQDGYTVVSYPDSTGYVPGYFEREGPDGVPAYYPCWYDVSGQVDGFAPRFLSPPATTTPLSYDPESGTYSFESPDYSAALSAIREELVAIRNTDYASDLHVSVSAPEVTVNPQITVNPSVVVPAPEVNVNPEVTFNPEVNVSVNPQVDLTPVVNLLQVDDQLPAFGTNNPPPTAEEQEVLDLLRDWDTQIPVIGGYFDLGLTAFLGQVPSLGQNFDAGSITISAPFASARRNTRAGGNLTIPFDFTPYAFILTPLRALMCMALVAWYFYAVWQTVTDSLKV